jgi:hypothetical protein
VIWEAFQPQTEEQKSFKSSLGDPYNTERQQQAIQAWQQEQLQRQQQLQQQSQSSTSSDDETQTTTTAPAPTAGLPTTNALK